MIGAVVEFEYKGEEKIGTILDKVRTYINSSNEDNYVIVDKKDKEIYVVTPYDLGKILKFPPRNK